MKASFFLIFLFIVTSCVQQTIKVFPERTYETTDNRQMPADSTTDVVSNRTDEDRILLENIFRNEFEIWKNTSHVMGSSSLKGTDCSGFVRQIYKKNFNIKLPRRVIDQANMKRGKRIHNPNELQAGDLVFFKQNPPCYPYHVGIYLSDMEFMHVSKSKGVTISRLDDPYHWKKYYWKAIRILTMFDQKNLIQTPDQLKNK